jgi:hypothetical protein
MSEDRGRKTEDRRQRTEDRGQKTEDRRQRTEVFECGIRNAERDITECLNCIFFSISHFNF